MTHKLQHLIVTLVLENLNADLLNVSTWMSANKLTLNNKITEFMVIGSNRRLGQIDQEPPICVGGVEIKKSQCGQVSRSNDR